MLLQPEEPEAGPWREVAPAVLLQELLAGLPSDRTAVLAVDGRGGSGKSTVAGLLAAAGGGDVVHTDDVAWNHSFFGWHARLVEQVLDPVAAGTAVRWRPAEWPDDKPGAIRVRAGVPLLVVEGVGAAAAVLAHRLDRVVWVQSDFAEAERLGLARDVAEGREPGEAKRFWDEWQAEEVPFQARERPWARADAIVRGHSGTAERLLVADGLPGPRH